MSLDFVPMRGSAVDLQRGLVIYPPRMLPASPPEDPALTEYQYAFYRGDDRIYGLGLFGSDLVVENEAQRELVFTLDLRRDGVLDAVLEFKRILGNDDEEFAFLKGLARGLVAVFERRADNDEPVRYVAVTDAAMLASRGIQVPDSAWTPSATEIVLAETRVPAHGYVGEVP